MIKKNIFAASLLLAFSISMNAQNTYEGGFGQNWFIGTGAGVNSLHSLGAGNGFDGRITPAAEVYFGKWFSPKVGARFGWQGVSIATAEDAGTNIGKMGMSYTHGDLLFNATSWLTPYVHAGALTGWKLVGSGKDNEMAMGAGLIGNVRISDHAALYMDIRSTLLPQRFAGVEGARYSMISSATAGISYNLSEGNRTGNLSNSYAEKDYNPILGGFWDNWFIQTGAGVNTMVSKRNGHGWNGRITPALETLVGKWFSPTFGARLGWQGLTFSQWGREASDNVFIANGIYKGGKMDKEKAGFNYIHGDILWDFTRTVAGYNPERLISVIPYLHAGYMNEYTVNQVPSKTFNNEWAAGAGLLNNVRIDDKMGVYFDMRAFVLNHTMTGDKLSGYAYAASATAGLYYNLGKPGFSTKASTWSDYSDDIDGSDWFVSSGYGINLFGSLKDSGYAPRVTPAYEVSFGRWVNPYFGGRFGLQGLSYSQWGSDPKSYVLAGAGDGKEPYMEKAGFAYLHGDLLWNLSNQIGGINPQRTVSFIPYYHFGLADVFKSTNGNQANRDFGLGGGLLTNILLSNRLSAYVDARATGYPSKMSLDKSSAYVLGLAFMGGLTWNLGGDSWTRTAETAGTDKYDSLLDSWFVQVGGGVNTFASKRHNVGFGGRITPATEVAVGRWLSPTFGIRAGWQGLSYSQWGEYPIPEVNFGEGTYKGRDVFKEKFGFNYVHADLMWDVTDSFGGYNADRFWRVVPYLHGGMVNAYSINEPVRKTFENELAGGAGLLNFFRISGNTSFYADFRAATMAAKLSGDTHSGRTFSASILAGLAYSFDNNGSRNRIRYNPDLPDGIIYNGFWDNWFVGISGGVNTLAYGNTGAGFNGRIAPAADFVIGKWFSPSFGLRLGHQGVTFSSWGTQPSSNIKYEQGTYHDMNMFKEDVDFAYIHSDMMWNVTNSIWGYKEDRIWNLIPYAHAGYMASINPDTDKVFTRNYAGGVGLINSFSLTDRIDLNADLRGFMLKKRMTGDKASAHTFAGSALLGLSFDIGKNYWSNGNGVLLNGLWDNWFIQAAAGTQTIAHHYNSVGFNGRFAPSEEIMIGKWFSPAFGGRIGHQGVALSEWGSAPSEGIYYLDGQYKDKDLSLEKFGSAYNHADLLWNFTNTVAGYNPDRKWDLIPYLHFGYINAFSMNSDKAKTFSREYASGAGLILSHDLDSKVSAYADMRAFLLKNRTTGDANALRTYAASASVGLTYRLGNSGSSFDRQGWAHSDVDQFDSERPAKRWSISTNLVDYADFGTANIEVQRVLSRHITTDMQGKFNVWRFSDNQKRDQRQTLAIGVRYWPWYTFSGLWFKGFAQVEEYSTAGLSKPFTIGRSSLPEKGSAYGAGISAGYALMLTKWFNLDFGIGAWGGYRDYFRFSDNSFSAATEHSHKAFVAPAELSVSAMFVF